MDEVLLGVATPGGGWCAPAEAVCVCGSTTWPHDCVWAGLKTTLALPEVATPRLPVLPPCPVCGQVLFPPAGGMHAVQTMHMLAHKRKGEVAP